MRVRSTGTAGCSWTQACCSRGTSRCCRAGTTSRTSWSSSGAGSRSASSTRRRSGFGTDSGSPSARSAAPRRAAPPDPLPPPPLPASTPASDPRRPRRCRWRASWRAGPGRRAGSWPSRAARPATRRSRSTAPVTSSEKAGRPTGGRGPVLPRARSTSVIVWCTCMHHGYIIIESHGQFGTTF